MRINCIVCGHNFTLDDAYDDFAGMVKCCVCGALLNLKTVEGKIQSVELVVMQPPHNAQRGASPAKNQMLESK